MALGNMMIETYHGDCLELMCSVPDISVDMILCDLPYGTTKCKWDVVIPFEPLWEHYKRIIKIGGRVVLFGKQPFTSILVGSNISWFREHLVWKKHKPSNFANGKVLHLNYTEDIIVFGNGKGIYNPQMQKRVSNRVATGQNSKTDKNWRTKRGENEVAFNTDYDPRSWNTYDANLKYPTNYLEYPAVVSNSKEKYDHPTQKPVALLEYLIKTYTNEGDLVLDNCMGSGSTAEACINTGRSFIGMEKDKKYFNIASERIQNLIANRKE